MRKISIGLLLFTGLILVTAKSYSRDISSPESAVGLTPQYDDLGNAWRPISVRFSTVNVVIISSEAEKSGLPIYRWRFREIVNTSDGILTLFPNQYGIASTTYSVVLGSDTNGGNMGDSWVVPTQAEVWGIWSTSTLRNGAGGSESYYK